jgi:hypothetical protein|tara:strand:- start:363 stop:599 length:237 start_codon:yes stop_codon:yes gene_type:complete
VNIKEKHIDINKAMSICIRAGVRVYPVPIGRMFAIEVVNGAAEPKRYDKLVSSNDVAAAQRKTYIMYARSLIKDQLDA